MDCPECGSTRIYKDGFRKAPLSALSNKPIQRYRCADYGHRFSKHFPKQILKGQITQKKNSQISVILQDAKNLTSAQ